MPFIYKISSPNNERIYVGSTGKKYVSNRKSDHHHKYKLYKQGKGRRCASYLLFDEYGFENCKWEIIEEVSNECQLERERYWYEQLNAINYIRPTSTPEEQKQSKAEWFQKYKEEKKEEYKERNHKSYLKQKDKMSEVIQCNCGKTYTANHKKRHMQTKFHQDNTK